MGLTSAHRSTRPRLALPGALVLLLLSGGVAAAQPRFSLEVSPRVVGLEDRVLVTVKIEMDGVSGPDRYWHPGFRHFTVLESREPEISTFSVSDAKQGRKLRTSVLRTYVLQPSRAGSLLISPARMRVGRKESKTDFGSVMVHVGSHSQTAGTLTPLPKGRDPTAAGGVGVPGFTPPTSDHRGEIFIHAVSDKREAFIGEQVIVTWLLYTRSEILRFEPTPASLDNWWGETLYEPSKRLTYFDTRVGRTPYQVVIIAKRALFPTRAGRVAVAPMSANVSSLTTALGRKKRVISNRLDIRVKKLPDGAPPGFDPTYVGRFTATASVDRTEIEAAESLTLTVTVRGDGAIRRTNPPRLSVDGFKFRDPRDFEESVDTSSEVVRGERTYRYWTTPQKGGAQQIPAINIAYFDPEKAEYAAASTKPIPIVVNGDPTELADPDLGLKSENVIGKDIRLLRDGTDVASRKMVRFYRSIWFWLLFALAEILFILIVSVDRVRQRLKRETPRARLRRARGRAKQRFRLAEIHLRGNRPSKFFGELSHVLMDHIEERVGEPVQSMTRSELVDFLKARGFAESTVRQINRDLEAFDQARFASSAAGVDEMRDALRRTKQVLRQIERTQLVETEEQGPSGGKAA